MSLAQATSQVGFAYGLARVGRPHTLPGLHLAVGTTKLALGPFLHGLALRAGSALKAGLLRDDIHGNLGV
ncbi:unnamed protein product [Prunus armeniaca]